MCAVCPVELTDIIIIHVLIGVGCRFVAEFERVKLAACERGDRADQPSWVINPWPHKTVPLTLQYSDEADSMTWTGCHHDCEHKLTMTPPWPVTAPAVVAQLSEAQIQQAQRMDDFEEEEEEAEEEEAEEGGEAGQW